MPASASERAPFSQYNRAARFQELVIYVEHHSHPFLACKTCLIAVPLAAVPVHFSTLKVHNYQARDVKQLVNAWIELCLPSQPVRLVAADNLRTWPYPTSPPYPAPLPALPVHYARHCTFSDPATGSRCAVLQRSHDSIAEHCRHKHGWANPVKRGRRPINVGTLDRPWELDVPCQRLRQTGVGAQLFRVAFDDCQLQAAPKARGKAGQDKTWAQLEAELDMLHANRNPPTLAAPNTTARYPVHMSRWLEKTGWPVYLEGQDLGAVACLLAWPTGSEPGLTALLQAFDELIEQARQSILAEEINIFALHRVNSFIPARPYKKPLQIKLLESTYKRYKTYWHRLLIYVYRLAILHQGPDLHYILTPAQQQALHQISTTATKPLSAQLQSVNLPSSCPQTPHHSTILPSSLSPPPLLPISAGSNKYDLVNAVARSTPPSAASSPALHLSQRLLRTRRQKNFERSPAEEERPGAESSESEHDPSRSPSPTLSNTSNAYKEQEEPYSNGTVAMDEAFSIRDSSPAAATHAQTASVAAPGGKEWQKACLQLCIALLDHKLKAKVTDSIVVGFLAANGINRERTGFEEAATATSALSGLVKLAQLLVVQHALCEHKAGATTHPGDLIAELQDRFMTYGSDSPINLVLNLRAYGAVVRNNTTAAGFIEWTDDGQNISYKGVQLNMNHLKWFLRDQMTTAYEQLAELLLLPDCEDDTWARFVPRPALSRLQDDPNRNGAGESFLDDPANKDHPVRKHPRFLLSRIKDSPRLQKHFFANIEQLVWNPEAVQTYLQLTCSFLRRLLLLIHMTGGQPARATELLLLRWRNSAHSDIRNIFIENGQVVFVTSYHKNYAQSSTASIIQRYLPRELGELLVWYLWMVTPFLHALHLLVKQQGDFAAPSPGSYLWPSSLLEAVQKQGVKRPLAVDSKAGSGNSQSSEQPWTSAQLGLVMKDMLAKALCQGLTVLIWRHIAISISRKHLPEGLQFRRDYSLYEGNTAMDLQASHSSNRAAISYARDRKAGPGFSSMLTNEFRTISRSWHAFLGFGGVALPPRNGPSTGHNEVAISTQSIQKRARENEVADLNDFLRGERMLRYKRSRKQQN